jgi:hypothetical protein
MPKLSPDKQEPTRPAEQWPLEIRCLFEALSRPAAVEHERRRGARIPCPMRARLWIARDSGDLKPIEAYLRDRDDRAVSFVTTVNLSPGQRIELEMFLPDGGSRRVPCRVGRCRQFSNGWFEGVLMASR